MAPLTTVAFAAFEPLRPNWRQSFLPSPRMRASPCFIDPTPWFDQGPHRSRESKSTPPSLSSPLTKTAHPPPFGSGRRTCATLALFTPNVALWRRRRRGVAGSTSYFDDVDVVVWRRWRNLEQASWYRDVDVALSRRCAQRRQNALLSSLFRNVLPTAR